MLSLHTRTVITKLSDGAKATTGQRNLCPYFWTIFALKACAIVCFLPQENLRREIVWVLAPAFLEKYVLSRAFQNTQYTYTNRKRTAFKLIWWMGPYIFLYIYISFLQAFTVYCEGIAECQVSCYNNCRADLSRNGRVFSFTWDTTGPVAKILQFHVWRVITGFFVAFFP